jgi:hypothetical protein
MIRPTKESKPERTACLWVCHPSDVRQRHVRDGCNNINVTMKVKGKWGQAWCKKCSTRTRISPMNCYQFETRSEAMMGKWRMERGDFL